MKYICNGCGKVIQENDVTIHHTKGSDGLEIVANCPSCIEAYLEKTNGDSYKKIDEDERMKMERK